MQKPKNAAVLVHQKLSISFSESRHTQKKHEKYKSQVLSSCLVEKLGADADNTESQKHKNARALALKYTSRLTDWTTSPQVQEEKEGLMIIFKVRNILQGSKTLPRLPVAFEVE